MEDRLELKPRRFPFVVLGAIGQDVEACGLLLVGAELARIFVSDTQVVAAVDRLVQRAEDSPLQPVRTRKRRHRGQRKQHLLASNLHGFPLLSLVGLRLAAYDLLRLHSAVTAATTRAGDTSTSASSSEATGNGTLPALTRMTGAVNESHASSARMAAIDAPQPS